MLSAQLPDWSRTGKRIGKRLRDVLVPPADTGPSSAERREQRLRDVFKGFAYFDTFEEVQCWNRTDVDPVQRANIAFVERTEASNHSSEPARAKLLLCHDYAGGYHDYESVQSSATSTKMYSCHYLQHVAIFVYFSHKLVCCPPVTWINHLHRNGVPALGSFVVEPQTSGLSCLFQQEEGGNFIVALRLADMAREYGFDGWLLNIEQRFPRDASFQPEKLVQFIQNLKALLGFKKYVIWYDAVTEGNEVDYQNGVTRRNVLFGKAAGSMFTNYRWTTTELNNTQITCQWHDLDRKDVFFGVDVWAQNTNMPGPKRITYPVDGGGGTNTGLAVQTLAAHGFSAAIFGIAWSHEHFGVNKEGQDIPVAVDHAVWLGHELPEDTQCDCTGRPHHVPTYREKPIIISACPYTVGSQLFFHTQFRSPYQIVGIPGESVKYKYDLGLADPLPRETDMIVSDPQRRAIAPILQCNLVSGQFKGPSGRPESPSLRITIQRPTQFPRRARRQLRHQLYTLDMAADGSLQGQYEVILHNRLAMMTMGLYTAYADASGTDVSYQDHAVPTSLVTKRQILSFPVVSEDASGARKRLCGIGLFASGRLTELPLQPLPMFEIYNLTVCTPSATNQGLSISNIRIIERFSGLNTEKRISWSVNDNSYNTGTGCFSYFEIYFHDMFQGYASSCEFAIREEDLLISSDSDTLPVEIAGITFTGAVSSIVQDIPRRDLL